MNLKISDIFNEKLNEIQSRLPIKMAGVGEDTVSFDETLDSAMKTQTETAGVTGTAGTADDLISSATDTGITDEASLIKAFGVTRYPKTAVTANIPTDKTEQLKLINEKIEAVADKYGVDPALIRAVIKQESDFNPYSLSSSGARGLMQLMPQTALALGVNDSWDIEQNIDGGTRYLMDQLMNFEGNLSLALAAYNAGPESVRKYGGIPPYEETQDYVPKVLEYYEQYKNAKG